MWTHRELDCINSSANQAYRDNSNTMVFVSGGVKKVGAHVQSVFLISLCLSLAHLCNTGHRPFSVWYLQVYSIYFGANPSKLVENTCSVQHLVCQISKSDQVLVALQRPSPSCGVPALWDLGPPILPSPCLFSIGNHTAIWDHSELAEKYWEEPSCLISTQWYNLKKKPWWLPLFVPPSVDYAPESCFLPLLLFSSASV